MKEIWRPVPIRDLERAFEVSNLGNVRYAPRELKKRNIQGYRQVTFKYRGKILTCRVHRLVLEAFGRAPTEDEVCNHINCDRSDNRIENLEWTTVQGNTDHSISMGTKPFGLLHPNAKIDPERAYKMRKDGKTLSEIADVFSASVAGVWALLKRIEERPIYKNVPWK